MPISNGYVYLLHFKTPLGNPKNPRGQAQHYIGFTADLEDRLYKHRKGKGSRLCAAALEKGIGFRLAEVWQGDRSLERKLKNKKKARLLCPICNRNNRPQILSINIKRYRNDSLRNQNPRTSL